ncbi:MAG TPA: FG-GAP-like repeat-containing protein [Polyangiaceae bacterium]
MHIRSLACLVVLGALSLGGICLHDARANTWPPAPGTDMTDPANWPNDPGYTSDWDYWSWLPKQLPGTQPYVSDDKTLGASGMHIDQAWTVTTGRPDVRIQICDCGIRWSEADLVNKAYLNAGELLASKNQAPVDPTTGKSCNPLKPASLGYDCDGDGVFTVADYLKDPRISPAMATKDPKACGGGMTIAGDKNQNCILDPGDLIEMFSDGVDDDHDGYTDDISGWDFYKNDNNPFDDTAYGHGTGEARMSAAQGNNAMGDIGACPDCRFQMGRVGDSFIADANDLGKCVAFGTDTGAKIVQEALGTIDQTAFSKAAIDYAYKKGVTVIASMADENSRHHNMPAVANHLLPVHALATNYSTLQDTNGVVSTDATSFIAFNTCSNYGGQNMLSISGQGCSSEATGKGAGVASLIYSEALNQNITLTAEELMQLMKMNAEVINVPESRSTNPVTAGRFYESLPYFSQRFGYGRPNTFKTMQAVDAGLIPPEVDIVSPAWFSVLYQNRVTAPVPVIGSIAAARAQSYDYLVEWAPGVEPSDAQFQPLTSWVKNVPPGTTSGGPSSPLAMLTPGQLDTSHTRDPDSPHGENDRTITLRIRAVAHYANGDVNGQARRSIAIVNEKNGLDEDLVAGFPVNMGASVETSPKLADIDGDGIRDVVAAASDGSLHVFSMRSGQPAEISGFPFHTNLLDGLNAALPTMPGCSDCSQVPSYLGAAAYSGGGIDVSLAREAIIATPAIGDINGDGRNDIVVSTWSGTVYALDHTGKLLPGWPQRLPLIPSCPQDPTVQPTGPCMDTGHKWSRGAGASPVLSDFDHDGKPEVVQAAFDGNIYVWKSDGTLLSGWPVMVHGKLSNEYNRILSTPAVADFNGDGISDIAVGSNEEVGGGGGSGNYFLIDGRGTNTPGGSAYFKNWPIVITSLHIFPLVAEGTDSAPAIADFTGSGHPEVLVQGNAAPPYVFPADPGHQASPFSDPPNRLPVYHTDAGTTQVGFDPTAIFGAGSKANNPDTFFPMFSHPAVGDVDQDGVPDVIMSGGSLTLAESLASQASGANVKAQQLLAMFSGATGHMTYGSPMPIEDFTFLVNQSVADISGDGYPEVILGTGGYFMHAIDACGCEAPSWPKFTDSWIIATTAVGDITGDHGIEVVGGTRDGNLYAWHTRGKDTGVIQWESFHHDNANTGNYMLKLDQGVLRGTTHPLDCTQDCAAQTTTGSSSYSPGGCGCRAVSATDERSAAFGAAIVLGLSGILARRRRRR